MGPDAGLGVRVREEREQERVRRPPGRVVAAPTPSMSLTALPLHLLCARSPLS